MPPRASHAGKVLGRRGSLGGLGTKIQSMQDLPLDILVEVRRTNDYVRHTVNSFD